MALTASGVDSRVTSAGPCSTGATACNRRTTHCRLADFEARDHGRADQLPEPPWGLFQDMSDEWRCIKGYIRTELKRTARNSVIRQPFHRRGAALQGKVLGRKDRKSALLSRLSCRRLFVSQTWGFRQTKVYACAAVPSCQPSSSWPVEFPRPFRVAGVGRLIFTLN